ncbi:MAG: hypothetical protein EXS31_02115 [Pedosphaera sp.]|nr:hypothetical protein [Pedosphaera sp.]
MKHTEFFSFIGITALLSVLAVGCVDISVGSNRPAHQSPPPAVIPAGAPLSPAEAATLSEIDAASRLSFDNGKLEALQNIAARPNLSAVVQVHLVNVSYRTLAFENNKVELLRKIIASPDFSDPARQAIVTQLSNLSFDSNRQRILRELNSRVTGK